MPRNVEAALLTGAQEEVKTELMEPFSLHFLIPGTLLIYPEAAR